MITRKQEQELEREAQRKFGEPILAVLNRKFAAEIERGALMTLLLTGNNVCQSLTDTVTTGGC